MEKSLSKTQLISELTKSPHGNLAEYLPIGLEAARTDPDFFAHLISWNHLNGQIRDAKLALPIIALTNANEDEYRENALAHLAAANPRDLNRALEFLKDLCTGERGFEITKTGKGKAQKIEKKARPKAAPILVPGRRHMIERFVERYLRDREAAYGHWEGTAIQHRTVMKKLYSHYHVKPASFAENILFQGAAEGKFGVLKALKTMTAEEAGGAITQHKLPFLVVEGIMGPRLKEPDVLLAIMKRMSPTELVTNTKRLERLGIKNVPALRAAFEAGLKRVASSKTTTLKATRAAEALEEDDPILAAKLKSVQETQIDQLTNIEGDWLVLADKSGSMEKAMEIARQVSGILSRKVSGKVHLVFFDETPRYFDVTGKSYEDIVAITKSITADNGTSIGCGLQWLLDNNVVVNGIAIISDGGENRQPAFAAVYKKYCERLDVEPTLYWYRVADTSGSHWAFWKTGLDVQEFNLTNGVDFYSLPNIVHTMRTKRYSLLDDILAVPLRTLDDVLTRTKGQEVIRREYAAVTA